MFGWFKKKPAAPVRTAMDRTVAARKSSRNDKLPWDAPALPEVTEGNTEADWSMWADSVAFQDSQMMTPESIDAFQGPSTEDEQVFERVARRKNS